MKKTLIAVALTTMFVSPMAFAVEDVCAKNPSHPLCNPTPPVEPPPVSRPPAIVVSPVIAPVIAPTQTTVNDNSNVNFNSNANFNNNSNVNNNTAQGGAGGIGYGSAAASASASGGAGGVGIGGSNSNSGNNTGTATVVVQGDAAQERNPVSTAVAPTVVTGNDQCLVPVAVGGQAIGFGLSVGVAVRDENCEVIKLSREVGQLAGKEAAIMMLRMHDKRVDEALKAVGK